MFALVSLIYMLGITFGIPFHLRRRLKVAEFLPSLFMLRRSMLCLFAVLCLHEDLRLGCFDNDLLEKGRGGVTSLGSNTISRPLFIEPDGYRIIIDPVTLL